MVTEIVGVVPADLQELRSTFRGEVLTPDDPGYDSGRTVFNAMIDKRPTVIARGTGVADVIRAVEFARSRDLLVSVRGGGHNVAGFAVCDGGLMIDLSRMSDGVIDAIVEHYPRVPSPLSTALIEHLGGAAGRVAPEATAFGRRESRFNLVIISKWLDPTEPNPHIHWARAFWEAIQPLATGAVLPQLTVIMLPPLGWCALRHSVHRLSRSEPLWKWSASCLIYGGRLLLISRAAQRPARRHDSPRLDYLSASRNWP
ncbi:MAG: FAD-binding protein [Chloroflexi bacterium]|nr:FAD-binding protein [Chloroflexota bacterium]